MLFAMEQRGGREHPHALLIRRGSALKVSEGTWGRTTCRSCTVPEGTHQPGVVIKIEIKQNVKVSLSVTLLAHSKC